ncbi:uncharacterized protein LOC121271198 isoform X2 [Carcharodon carcharias]|uniref:uncharacterized protein LOC121271198 isoform X2 n=1 Tax=Carcharodon carcharias TaxID=13397 RepID=UPI001B7D938D|nr:uncharacterized protein LOC121271198 isoform X2 [Carcharodon carcharias]
MRRRGGAIVFLHHWPCWGRESRARQAAFEITARYCSKEMEDYGQCVASNPASWQKDCHQLKTSVAQCTSSQGGCTAKHVRAQQAWDHHRHRFTCRQPPLSRTCRRWMMCNLTSCQHWKQKQMAVEQLV